VEGSRVINDIVKQPTAEEIEKDQLENIENEQRNEKDNSEIKLIRHANKIKTQIK